MKKLFILASILLSAQATAGQISAGTTTGTSTPVSIANCSTLQEAVTINLSKGVNGGYSCGTNVIGFGACHTAGRSGGHIYAGSTAGGSVSSVGTGCSAAAAETAASTAAGAGS